MMKQTQYEFLNILPTLKELGDSFIFNLLNSPVERDYVRALGI